MGACLGKGPSAQVAEDVEPKQPEEKKQQQAKGGGQVASPSKKEVDSHILEYIKKVPLLSKLTDDDRHHMASALVKRYYEKGQDIITQGDPGKEFFIIMEGTADVIRIDDAKAEKHVAELHAGDYFGEAALLNNDKRGASIRAKEHTYCLSLDAETFHKLFGKNKLNVHFAKRQAIAPESTKATNVVRDPALFVKSQELADFLANSMAKTTKIFKDFETSQLSRVVEGMWKVEVKQGESIIKQGDPGDNFYIVEKGEFDIFKNGAKVNHAGPGTCFGELALIYNAPRAATVTALVDAIVWAVDRHAFRNNLKKINQQKLEEYESFLVTVPVFQPLLKSERLNVAEALEEMKYPSGAIIVKQGEPGDAFFIIKEGEVSVTKKEGDSPEKEVNVLKRGQFFGELALLNSEPRAATVTAKGAVECLTLNRGAFNALLGPLHDILARHKWDAKEEDAIAANAARKVSTGPIEKIKRDELEIVGTLGRGSFGLVQLVKHKKTGKTYALKQISKSQVVELGQQEHVMSEKNVMAAMNHPFIIKLHATYRDAEFLYFLLEVCLGGELFTLLRSQRLFDEQTAKFYAGCVVLAFEHMHLQSIIYRDLKPENLLLDEQGYIKIVDFGFAKICNELTYTLCGTPDYLAPEVIMGQGHAKGVDWWTLGVLIFEMLASYPPFYDEDPMETYKKILSGQVEYPRHFSKEAIDLLTKLLNVKPTKRYGVMKGGATLIKNHPWFQGFDWEALYAKQIKSPFLPEVRNKDDLHNFAALAEEELEFDFPKYVDDGSGWDAQF